VRGYRGKVIGYGRLVIRKKKKGEFCLEIIEALYRDQSRTAIDLVVTYHLDELAEKVGLQPLGESNDTAKLMTHRTYQRVGRRVRRREGKVIA